MVTSRSFSFILISSITMLGGLSSPAHATVPLAEKPLYLGTSVKPAFIMAVDDSGSMAWEILSKNQDGELVWGRDSGTAAWGFFRDDGVLRPNSGGSNRTEDWLELFPFEGRSTKRRTVPPIPGFGFARSPDFNPAYYNPAATYLPWQNFDGTSYPSMSTVANWTSMKLDPRSTSSVRYDLTTPIKDQSNDTSNPEVTIFSNRALYSGIRLKKGWQIRSNDNNNRSCSANPSNISVPRSSNSRFTLDRDYTLTAACSSGVNVWKPADSGDTDPRVIGNGETFDVREGMVIPTGTTYFTYVRCGGLGNSHASLGEWSTLTSDVTLDGTCDGNGDGDSTDVSSGNVDFNVGFEYFAPTYYLSDAASTDGNTNPILFNGVAGGPRASTTPSGGKLYRYEIKPGNYVDYAAYAAAMTNYANWFLYYRTRNLAMVAALTRSLNDVDFMRIGYFKINATRSAGYGTNISPLVMHEMSDFSTSASVAGRKRLYEEMVELDTSGNTPNGWAVDQMARQFNRTAGTTSPTSEPPIISECQFNAGMLFTDGYSNENRPQDVGNRDNAAPFNKAPFNDGNSNTMADIAAHYYVTNPRPDLPAGAVPVVPGCSSATPDLKLDCNRDLHVNLYGITLGAAGNEFGVNYQQDPDTLAITPDIFIAGNKPAWSGWSDNSRGAVDDIWHATVNSRGQFVNATSPESISSAMNAIIQSINNAARRSAGTAASGARRAVGFTAYVPEFDPSSWTGDVKAYMLQPDGRLGGVAWSAEAKLPLPAARKILVSLPKAGGGFELKDFQRTNLGATAAQQQAALGLAATDFSTGGKYVGRTVQQAVDFLRGDKTWEALPGQSTIGYFRSRVLRNVDGTSEHRVIGDILGSQPEVLDRGTEGYSFLPVAQGGRLGTGGTLVPSNQAGTYSNFFATTKQTRKPVLIVGSNDGMIHGFDASTNLPATTAGTEIFAVMPNSVLAKTGQLLNPAYRHTYFVDGSPRVADACIGSATGSAACGWKTVAVTPMGVGGRSVIALDVTDPATSFTTSNMLWEFSSADNAEMGFVVNQPRVYVGEDGVWYAAFGNGLNSQSHKPRLFIVNLKTGALVRDIVLGTAGDAADPNGAMSVAAVDDGTETGGTLDITAFNGLVDTLYVADFHGKIWKINASTGAIKYGGNPMYTAQAKDTAERADKRQFVTGNIDVALHPLRGNMVVFGTGRYIATGDGNVPLVPNDRQIQTFYAIWDDPNQSTGFTGRTALQEQTINTTVGVDGVNRRTTSENPVVYTGGSAKRGWFMDLYQASGAGAFRNAERVLGAPRVEGGNVIFTAFQPIGTDCNPGGRNWLYSLNVVSGANALNIPGCGKCGATDLNPEGSSAPPTLNPPIVSDPVPDAPIDTDGDGVPDTVPDPNCIPGTAGCVELPSGDAALPGRTCVTRLSVLLPNAGLSPFTQIACGRQSWRQIR